VATKIILYPTDTIYGLAVDATDADAVSRLFELKGRNENKPISIVVSDLEMMRNYAVVTPLAEKLAAKFLPGKLTLVLDAKDTLPKEITAGTGTVGIRIPNHPVAMRLVAELGKPISATSANVADLPTLKTPQEILGQFGERVGMITDVIDEGELPESLPSSVVDARGNAPKVIREGAVSVEEIFAV
jgi:L-threonylcarbamoyladenylate synthase